MHLIRWYNKHKSCWWALPLILPTVLLYVAFWFNAYTEVEVERVFLIYMPLAMLTASAMLFSWAAIPGIVLALLIHLTTFKMGWVALFIVAHFLISIYVSLCGYHIFVPRRNAVSFGFIHLSLKRLFWLVLFNTTLFMMIFQVVVYFNWYDYHMKLISVNPFNARTLINFQAIAVGCLTGIPFFYNIIRMIRNPSFVGAFYSQMRRQVQRSVTKGEILLWLGLMLLLVCLLVAPQGDYNSILRTDYTLTIILPVMLWGATRFGFLFITNIWTMILLILCTGFHNYLSPYISFQLHLAIASSCYAIFSITIYMMAVVTTRQRFLHAKARRVAFIDPLLQMPNLRALNRDISSHPWSTVGLLCIPELELLGRNYGMLLRIQYKLQLVEFLYTVLKTNEAVYNLPGHDLGVRLNYDSHQTRIKEIDLRVKQFRFVWDGMPLQPQIGISYCYVRHPVTHLYLLLGELSAMAELSLTSFQPENLNQQGASRIQDAVKSKVAMMNRLQVAIEHGNFTLMAQRIEGIRGDVYHEILLRMAGREGELLAPESFLPIAYEFGLSSKIDSWVVEATLKFMDNHREKLLGYRFAINLTAASVGRSQFPCEVKILLEKYGIEAWQLIFEVTESNSSINIAQVNMTLSALQHMGCRVAIDDFGAGYSNYSRFKDVNADMLKIDGSFIGNILTSSLDYQIVDSICQLARIKKMQVVAESVESEKVKQAVKQLGIDYMQGYLIGRPQPLESLVEQTG